MAIYQLHFTVPQQRQGEREFYRAFATTLKELSAMRGKSKDGASIQDVDVTGGSIRGFANIEAPSYQEALGFICRNTPIIDLEWHLEERVQPDAVERILGDAMKHSRK